MAETTKDSLTGLEFTQDGIESTFRFTEAGDPNVLEVGDGLSYTANLYDSNNVFAGTKDISFVLTEQLEDGDYIANVEETTYLPCGEIYTLGSINATEFDQLKCQKIDIIGGSGIYDGVTGKEYITRLDSDVLDVSSISFKFS